MSGDIRSPDTVAAVVFDWAGTVVDFGGLASLGAFMALFAQHGVSVTAAEARAPMGQPKRDHIAAMTASGNEVGLSLAEWNALPAAQQTARATAAERRLAAARLDFVLRTVAELPAVVELVERRLRDGQRTCL